MEQRIIEGNKLISEFLFPNIESDITELPIDETVFLKVAYIQKDFENMLYHSSCWWQETLIDKIESIPNIHVSIDYKTCRIFNFTDLIISKTCETKKEAIFEACIDFIKFINFNKKH